MLREKPVDPVVEVDYSSLTDDYDDLSGAAVASWSPELRQYAAELDHSLTFAVRLLQLRSSLGLTQGEVGELVGEQQSEISRMENARVTPGYERATRILGTLERAAATAPATPPAPSVAESLRRRLYRAREVAACLLSIQDADDRMTNLKIQKLLYFVQGFSYVRRGQPMFRDQILAWTHGPVVQSVWAEFTRFGREPIDRAVAGDFSRIEDEDLAIIRAAYHRWGRYEAWTLREMTHATGPWRNTDQSARISEDAIRDYFVALESAMPASASAGAATR